MSIRTSIRTSPPVAAARPIVERHTKAGRGLRRLVTVLLTLSAVLTFSYAAISIYIDTKLVYEPQKPPYATPASLGLQYKDVIFPSREDHLQLHGWFIPGVLSQGRLTAQRVIITVHGNHANRVDKSAGLLNFSAALARHGFAVLAFDMRGNGQSPPAPLSLGYFEQRDVLGAVDFLRSGPLPYPDLGRPRSIAGWGVSLGASTLLLAAAREPALRAIVSDSAFTDALPLLEREVPKGGHLPAFFTPGALLAAHAIYGMDFYDVRPVDVVTQIAPRPLFFIHGDADSFIPPSDMSDLAVAARTGSHAHVQTWLVPGAAHAQCYTTHPQEYVSRVIAFYTAALGPESRAASSSK